MGNIAQVDMRDLSPNERLVRWGEVISSGRNRVSVQTDDSLAFSGTISVGTLGPVRMLRVEAGPHRLERPPGNGGPEIIPILIQARGAAVMSQDGMDVHLTPGCWTAWTANRAHAITSLTDVEQYAVLVPAPWLGLRPHEIRAMCGRAYGGQPGLANLVFHYIFQLFQQYEGLDTSVHSDMADIIGHLVRLAMNEAQMQRQPVPMRDTLRGRVIDYVRHRLRDPDLSIDAIAEKFGCTKRHLHKVFSDEAVTLSQFIWQERLERCREALVDPAHGGKSVTEIAFMWGFNNSSHFSKIFKDRFGMPPGQWRLTALAGRDVALPAPLS
ncbi:transcriptional regulator [Sphingobium jiangsuense]|uniref:AraC-like DNA-binding protein n=1 Tax=Sphingobium jiangsuense TaxID=870476 RepID=A0A7W6BLB0_9SPHN|nr:helix-turn-helix domain-containing protein [Sphingobium jiangsuense]MBB3925672.1 AraC-like DNA-binding protein [Sphingobium jiangsuense]GLT01257.1 transcriptional regulator [Sphingobium jiangsuense]